MNGEEAGSGAPEVVINLLQQFLECQRERAQQYARFSLGFKGYLEHRNERTYKALMAELTSAFSACSLKVRAIQSELQKGRREELAAMLGKIQENEREKLQLTLSLQALKQAGAANAFSWQKNKIIDGVGPSKEEEALDPLEPSGHQQEGCAHAHAHDHGHGHGHDCAPLPPPEPSQEEYNQALGEAFQLLDKCVAQINEYLEEIRYAVEELREEI